MPPSWQPDLIIHHFCPAELQLTLISEPNYNRLRGFIKLVANLSVCSNHFLLAFHIIRTSNATTNDPRVILNLIATAAQRRVLHVGFFHRPVEIRQIEAIFQRHRQLPSPASLPVDTGYLLYNNNRYKGIQ